MSTTTRTAPALILREDPIRPGLWWAIDREKGFGGYGTCARDAEALLARLDALAIGDRVEAADGSVHWTTRPVDPIAYVQRCPYAVASRKGEDYRQRTYSSLRLEALSVPDHYCTKRPEADDAMRALRAGLTPVGKFGACVGPREPCPRIESTHRTLDWTLVRGPTR